jgi:hypothetical protein
MKTRLQVQARFFDNGLAGFTEFYLQIWNAPLQDGQFRQGTASS